MAVGWPGCQCLDLQFGTLHGVVGFPEQFETQISACFRCISSIVSEPNLATLYNAYSKSCWQKDPNLEGEDNLSGSKRVIKANSYRGCQRLWKTRCSCGWRVWSLYQTRIYIPIDLIRQT